MSDACRTRACAGNPTRDASPAPGRILNVFFTVDVEIWCDGWTDIDRKFPGAFRRYVYGETPGGEFGLRFQVDMLRDHGLTGVFFVEPLFTGRFGAEPLAEVVDLIRSRDQEVQLHLHTEWIDEWPEALLPGPRAKRQYLRDFSVSEQTILIREGARRLQAAGVPQVECFRAGSFGFNAHTLDALAACGIANDSSYNATMFGPNSGVAPGILLQDVRTERGINEFPMAIYKPRGGRLRHVQLSACSWPELEGLLWSALESGRQTFTILSHNFELLGAGQRRADPIAISRFRRLCAFLDRHRDRFATRGFADLPPLETRGHAAPLTSPLWKTLHRNVEQVVRRKYR